MSTPSPTPAKNTRRIWPLLVSVVLFAGLITGGVELQDMRQRGSVTSGCHSDKLVPLRAQFQAHAKTHAGHFPEPSRVAEVLLNENETNLLYCVRTRQQFIWSSELARIPLDSPTRRLLAWCSPGSHGRYVGVLTIHDRKVEAEIITVDELQRLKDSELQ